MDTKRGEMSKYHSQSEDEATVRFLACNGCSAWRVLGAAKTVIRVP